MWFLVFFLLFVNNAVASIGAVSEAKGTACQIERNKSKLAGDKGASIESMDAYITGGCVSNLLFKDETKVKVTENSRLVIDDFVFDPKQSDAGKLALKVGLGTVRYASGQIAKANPQQVGIQTPTATIAVRGTDFTMTVDETGQSLIVLLPSCKDDKDVKQYELQENTCKVGKIVVENDAGAVTLDQAFHATYVQSRTSMPTTPEVISIVESKINNNLIVAAPKEIVNAVKQAAKTKKDEEQEDLEKEAARRLVNQVAKTQETIAARVEQIIETATPPVPQCNPTTNVCVQWEQPNADGNQKGKGTAYRITPDEHYAEVKTQGYSSNTSISINQNDSAASTMIGDSSGGNIINITQTTGVLRR
jgi:FecR protein